MHIRVDESVQPSLKILDHRRDPQVQGPFADSVVCHDWLVVDQRDFERLTSIDRSQDSVEDLGVCLRVVGWHDDLGRNSAWTKSIHSEICNRCPSSDCCERVFVVTKALEGTVCLFGDQLCGRTVAEAAELLVRVISSD